MCGIFACFSRNESILQRLMAREHDISATITRRGPDKTTSVSGKNFFAVHTLLSMTGYAVQPALEKNWLLVFNGEIYNDFENYTASYGDTQYLMFQLEQVGNLAFKKLDGEYAICVQDRKNDRVYLVSDPFATKPLYYLLGLDYLVVASYESTLRATDLEGDIVQVGSNQILSFDTKSFEKIGREAVRSFDFGSATKNHYDDWNEAFARAIRKRTTNIKHGIWIGLSSGHDSGLIAVELLAQKVPFHVYSVFYKEDEEILRRRISLLEAAGVTCQLVKPDADQFAKMKSFLDQHCEAYDLINSESDYQPFAANPDLRNVPGYVVSAIIHEDARRHGRLISLSGQGADEIIADYYCEFSNPRMSELKGRWELATKPWTNFVAGWNRVFLNGSERIAGTFGVETRYPFLDGDVVQEFLNLAPALKGQAYKAPITHRLQQYQFPYHLRKFGFAGYGPDSNQSVPEAPLRVQHK